MSKNSDVVYHVDWDFCARCFTERPSQKTGVTTTEVNIFPYATQLRRWLRQEEAHLDYLPIPSHEFDNPYSQHALCLIHVFRSVMNDYLSFIKEMKVDEDHPWFVDIKRIRLTSELILYCTRISAVQNNIYTSPSPSIT